ncbi:MAG: LysR substrate-binding domain-containing protein [Streptosporangiaceae bacterium]
MPFDRTGISTRVLRPDPVGVILRADDPLARRGALQIRDLGARRWFQFPEGTDQLWRAYWNGTAPGGALRDGPVVRTVGECVQAVLWNGTIGLAHTGTLEVRPALQRQRPVAGAGRDDHGFAVDDFPVLQVPAEQVAVPVSVEPDRLAGAGQLGTELHRLEHGPAGQVGTGQAERETEVVLDPGAGRGLPAGAHSVQQHSVQALGRPRKPPPPGQPGPRRRSSRQPAWWKSAGS